MKSSARSGKDSTAFRGVPMLVCWGEQDFIFDRHFLDEWAGRFPEAEFIASRCGAFTSGRLSRRVVPLVVGPNRH